MPENSTSHPADPRDVESIDAIIAATYEVISGPNGQKRDWNRERSLFYPGARIMPTAKVPGRNDVELEPQLLDVEKYIARVEPLLQQGFYETEVARRTEQFGRIAHVWSTYESRYNLDEPDPFMRGINSFQLFNDGTRWWILSIYWQHESADHAIPGKYL
ncbi:MAG TPA: hypothetical protein VL136_05920 [Candidatus Babeliales bacterium]|jgi:hypothetical protein|nr:hypothetical protein [Candidatus Babeliales bacterium]HXI74616.1 hypothetical protein [Pyrinomonadaceae bacterium]